MRAPNIPLFIPNIPLFIIVTMRNVTMRNVTVKIMFQSIRMTLDKSSIKTSQFEFLFFICYGKSTMIIKEILYKDPKDLIYISKMQAP